jgi:energy-coupling factor transport system permease protein
MLHPGAWWAWAIALAATAGRTTNPVLLLLIGTVLAVVVSSRRPDAPWARAFSTLLKVGLFVIAFRVLIQVVLGLRTGAGTVILDLPSVALPEWAAGVSLGGPVTVESLALAVVAGLQLAVLLLAVGAAASLSSPYRLLRCLPAALYEVGVAVTVALSFTPQAVVSAQRARAARRLRGRPTKGPAGLRGLAVPVLEGALERSLRLAESMDARGYGRRADVPRRVRAVSSAALLGGLLAACVGAYGLLGGGIGFGVPAAVTGALLLSLGLVVAGRRSPSTRYRPDPWAGPEWITSLAGLAALVAIVAAEALGVAGLRPSLDPLEDPGLPLLPALGLLVAALPAFLTPRPPSLLPRHPAGGGTALPRRDRTGTAPQAHDRGVGARRGGVRPAATAERAARP